MPTIVSLQPVLCSKYFDFLMSNFLVDSTIFAEEASLPAHKVVLAAASSYFEDIFAKIPIGQHPAIILNEFPGKFLGTLMELIYCGKVDVQENEILQFQGILRNLKIESIVKKECQFNFGEAGEELSMPILEEIPKEVKPKVKKIQIKQEHLRQVLSRGPKQRIKVESVVKGENEKTFMDLNPEVCPFCYKTSKSNKHRNEHVKYCKQNPDHYVAKCPYCSKIFCDPFYVRKHVRAIHENIHNVALKIEKIE